MPSNSQPQNTQAGTTMATSQILQYQAVDPLPSLKWDLGLAQIWVQVLVQAWGLAPAQEWDLVWVWGQVLAWGQVQAWVLVLAWGQGG